MKQLYWLWAIVAVIAIGCSRNHKQDHEQGDHEHETEVSSGHSHDEAQSIKLVYYSKNLELFGEATPLVAGEEQRVLLHFTQLADFKPLAKAQVGVTFQGTPAQAEEMEAGIYALQITPVSNGETVLQIRIKSEMLDEQMEIPVSVYADDHEAYHTLKEEKYPAGSVAFLKEQSWLVEFATALPQFKALGPVIRTTARVEALPSRTLSLVAKSNGVVQLVGNSLLAGSSVSAGQALFRIQSSGMGEDNASLAFENGRSDFELAQAEYERMKKLAEKQIVSQRELLESKNKLEKARSRYQTMQQNFNPKGQTISAPQSGIIEKLNVQNGQFVNSGDALATVSVFDRVKLVGGVQQKYAAALSKLSAMSVHTGEKGWMNLDELNGKVLAVGQKVQEGSYLLPLYVEAENPGVFQPGSLVELSLATASEQPVVVVPGTALIEQEGNFFVFVQVHPELFEKRQVIPGANAGAETVILSGLSAQERIVTKGAVLVKLASVSSKLDPHAGHSH